MPSDRNEPLLASELNLQHSKGVEYRENIWYSLTHLVQNIRTDTGIATPPSLRVIPEEFSKMATVAIANLLVSANFLAIAESKTE